MPLSWQTMGNDKIASAGINTHNTAFQLNMEGKYYEKKY
jgi:hypothetical protein